MKFQKTINLPETTSDDKDLLKKVSKFMIDEKKNHSINKEIRIKTTFVLSIKHNTIV